MKALSGVGFPFYRTFLFFVLPKSVFVSKTHSVPTCNGLIGDLMRRGDQSMLLNLSQV